MKLFLVRHGVAVDRIGGDIRSDFDRPLTPEGREECEEVAAGLKRLGVKPQALVSSPLLRARQTGEVFVNVLAKQSELIICKGLAPGGKFPEIFAAVPADIEQVMFFGHEPDMSRFALHLLSTTEVEMPFKKAGVCRIDVPSLPADVPGVLKWMITPKIARLMK